MIRLVLMMLTTGIVPAEKPKDVWKPMEYFLGSWEGQVTGSIGIGSGERTYEFVFGRAFLLSKNTSTFKPQEKNPRGEVHQDWEILSYDRQRKLFVIRQFHLESFVVHLRQDVEASSDRRFVFVLESIENGPPGLQARLVLEIRSEDQFVETFDVSGGIDLNLVNTWTRVRP